MHGEAEPGLAQHGRIACGGRGDAQAAQQLARAEGVGLKAALVARRIDELAHGQLAVQGHAGGGQVQGGEVQGLLVLVDLEVGAGLQWQAVGGQAVAAQHAVHGQAAEGEAAAAGIALEVAAQGGLGLHRAGQGQLGAQVGVGQVALALRIEGEAPVQVQGDRGAVLQVGGEVEAGRHGLPQRQRAGAQVEGLDAQARAALRVAVADAGVHQAQAGDAQLDGQAGRAAGGRLLLLLCRLPAGAGQIGPVVPPPGVARQVEGHAAQHDVLGLHPLLEQRQQGHVHVHPLEAGEGPLAEAGRVAQLGAAQVQPQPGVERPADVAGDAQRAAGALLHLGGDVVLEVVGIEGGHQQRAGAHHQQHQQEQAQQQPLERLHGPSSPGAAARRQVPDLPPRFSSRRTSVMVMPRSTALHMS